MITLTAQTCISLCVLVFAVLALRISRRIPRSQPAFRYVWALTGGTFLIRGANSLFHDVFSIIAFTGGAESRAWAAVMKWHPLLNHSRTFLLVAYCAVLCVVLVRAERRLPLPAPRTSLAFVVLGMGVGALVGWQEDAFSALTHFSAVAVWDILEMLALMAVLLVGISTGSLDRGMWACLGINAFALTLSVLWFAFLSRFDVPGEWRPRPYQIQVVKVFLYLGMNWVAVMQLRQVRRGTVLRSFVDDRSARPISTLHA
jgi:hypothetical protein